jgi:hypothetical protein
MTISCTLDERQAFPKGFWLGITMLAVIWALLGFGTAIT